MITEINLTPTGTQFEIPTLPGAPIEARSWGNAVDCKAVALLVHGLGAHSGWFEAFGRQLKIRGVYAVSFDLIGFGKQRAVPFSSYKQWIDDLVRVFDYLKSNVAAGKPIYLIGNSMGGLLSLVAVDYIQPAGLILLSPGFDGSPECFTLGYRIRAMISALLSPDKDVKLPYGPEQITRDRPAQDWIRKDPGGQFSVAGKYLLELLKLSNTVKSKARRVSMPVLMLTAGHDTIVNNQVNQEFFTKLAAPEKKARQFGEAWHDLMFDPLVDEVAEEVVKWISEADRSVDKSINDKRSTGNG